MQNFHFGFTYFVCTITNLSNILNIGNPAWYAAIFSYLHIYKQTSCIIHMHRCVSVHTYICMLNFASLATKSVAWAPSQHYNIVVWRPVPNSVRNLHTYEYDLKFVRMYIHMCINANKRTTRIPNYIHTYICTCIYICLYSQLHTSHKPKKIITPKKCKRRASQTRQIKLYCSTEGFPTLS